MAGLTGGQPLQAPHRGNAGSSVDVRGEQAHVLVKKNDHLPKNRAKK